MTDEQKISKEQKEKMQIVIRTDEPSYLVVAAVARDEKRNTLVKISCKRGIPFGGYVYDNQSETYHYECCDYLHLGVVPVSAYITLKENSNWKVKVPLSESVLKKFLSEMQKKELKTFRNHFPITDFDLHFIQMTSPN
jgi:hypothetical protein